VEEGSGGDSYCKQVSKLATQINNNGATVQQYYNGNKVLSSSTCAPRMFIAAIKMQAFEVLCARPSCQSAAAHGQQQGHHGSAHIMMAQCTHVTNNAAA